MNPFNASDVFVTPPLSAATTAELKAIAKTTATDIITRSQQAGTSSSWSMVFSDKALRIFKFGGTSAPIGTATKFLHCGQLQVRASLQDVVHLLRTDDAAHATAYKQRFCKDILATSTLYMLKPPTPTTPTSRISISWYAFRSPVKGVVMNRDAILLECHQEFTIQGRRGWVRAVRSVQLPGCPNLEITSGLVRMQNYGSGQVFLESLADPNFLDMSYVTQVDMGVGKSEWAIDALRSRDFLVEKAIVRRCQSLREIERYLKGDPLHVRAPETARPFKALRRHCCLCDKRFRALSKKFSCAKCPLVTRVAVICRGLLTEL
ncbi:hypothetical protein, variant [Aphanomyces invadans]|uniref:START domain-containing protein n=1 Tax=Aphanomyces invadans TaxID=157072 RepID=A0A024TR29_9STRA|nr:hypothetical protein, variant [Aphanomyces invadans]ETV96434.1 hypothetical protein, variant [Aphanomyces invadans]|eukprot:XP_008874697.1 hypothetical protein, variant [Aphanomyces invadans]